MQREEPPVHGHRPRWSAQDGRAWHTMERWQGEDRTVQPKDRREAAAALHKLLDTIDRGEIDASDPETTDRWLTLRG